MKEKAIEEKIKYFEQVLELQENETEKMKLELIAKIDMLTIRFKALKELFKEQNAGPEMKGVMKK